MTKKVAVVLSGCGIFDGSEIHESVITLLALDRANAEYQCLAPNITQHHVTNHLVQEVMPEEKRNVLVESARIARGKIINIADADTSSFDAAIFPGGFGAATNLCDFAHAGVECTIQADILTFAKSMLSTGKPLGFICISPVMISKIYGAGVEHTIGNDPDTSAAIKAMGGKHEACPVGNIIVDAKHKVVSTPAYMLAKNISEAAEGIEKLVHKVLSLT